MSARSVPKVRSNDYLEYRLFPSEGRKLGTKYSICPRELRRTHRSLVKCSDAQFRRRKRTALHLACLLAWIKNVKSADSLSDIGVIHELVHLVHIKMDPSPRELERLRHDFKKLMPTLAEFSRWYRKYRDRLK